MPVIINGTVIVIVDLFEEGVGLEPDFRAFFRLKSVTELLGTF